MRKRWVEIEARSGSVENARGASCGGGGEGCVETRGGAGDPQEVRCSGGGRKSDLQVLERDWADGIIGKRCERRSTEWMWEWVGGSERSCTTVCTRRKRGNVCWKEREETAESRVYDGVPIGNVDNVEGESGGKHGKNTKGIGTVDTKEEFNFKKAGQQNISRGRGTSQGWRCLDAACIHPRKVGNLEEIKKERDMQGRRSRRQKGLQKTGVQKTEPLDGLVRAGKWRKHVEWMSGDPNDIGVCGKFIVGRWPRGRGVQSSEG